MSQINRDFDVAKSQCLKLCPEIIQGMKSVIVQNMGTIYYNPLSGIDFPVLYEFIFVHGVKFSWKKTNKIANERKLLFIYNLEMNKKHIRSRDRDALPRQWCHSLINLIRNSDMKW